MTLFLRVFCGSIFFLSLMFQGISSIYAISSTDVPGTIEKISASITPYSARLRWAAPVSPIEFPITDYIIQYKDQSTDKYSTAKDEINTKTNYLLQNLNPDTLYNIRIIAVNENGYSMYKIFKLTTKRLVAPGVCGVANNTIVRSFPQATNLCKSGLFSITDNEGGDGQYNWTCTGINSLRNASCQASVYNQNPVTGSSVSGPKLFLANPKEYSGEPGKKISIKLFWEMPVDREREYLQFMHLDNGQTSYSVDDHDFLFLWSNGTISDLRTITLPANIPDGVYDILVGLSGLDSSSKWVNFPLDVGPGVTNDGDNRYKVGTLTVGTKASPTPIPPVPANYTYSWSSSSWGVCSLSCGGGNQTRTVTCLRNDGINVADSYCSGTKPIVSQSCNTQSCSPPPPSPTPTPNTLTTVNLASPQSYIAVAGTEETINLNWIRSPLGTNYLQFMHLDNGTYSFSIDDHWVNSTNWGGSAVDTRTVLIPSTVPAGKYDILVGLSGGNPWQNITLLPGSNVTNAGENRYKVGTITITNVGPTPNPTPTPTPGTISYSWSTGSWGVCSLSCGGGNQTRSVTCLSSNGTTVADSFCSGAKPSLSQSCNTQSCNSNPGTTGVVYGPRVTNFTSVVGPIYPKAGETISGMRISNPSGPCIVVNQPNVTIRDNEIGPCMHSPESMNTPWGASPNGFGVQISGGSNITIEFNKFDHVTNGVYASDGAAHPIIIRHNTATNIKGPMPRGQFVQFNTVSGGNGQTRIYCNVSDVRGSTVEGVEDHINMYSSYGSVLPIEIAYNRIRGGHSVTGSAIMTGDSSAAGAGGGIYVHDNTVVEVANTGIGVAGGENIRIENNRVYMTGKYGPTRIGMYAYAYVPVGGVAPLCRNNSFVGNRVWAINTIDNAGSNPFWHDTSTCSNITDSGNTWGDSTLNESIFNEIPQYCVDSAKSL